MIHGNHTDDDKVYSITQAINQGLEVLSKKNVFELYRDRKITLQKAAEMLSLDIFNVWLGGAVP